MRDIGLALILCVVLPMAFRRPWFGALAWVWISVLSPHRMTYGFMYDAPVAQLIALACMLGLVFSKEHRRVPMAPPVVWMILFTVWMVITFPFSLLGASENWPQLDKVLKVMLMNLVVLAPLYTRKHVDQLIAVFALSLAFFGTKGGVFAIATGGNFQVRGGGGFIEPNNELALALVTGIPLVYYLSLRVAKAWQRWGLLMVIFLMSVAAIASQSRGALLAIAAMTGAFILRSPSRIRLIIPIVLTAVFILAFMPDKYWDRIETINTYQSDASAMGRINAWMMAWNIATSNFFGGGFSLEVQSIFDRYAPDPSFIAVAHSNYFQVLGQHGFVGLILYLGIWISMYRSCLWIYKNSNEARDKQLARMIEISMAGFFVGGAFLNLAFWDGPYYVMIAVVILRYKILSAKTVQGGAGPKLPPAVV